MKTSVLVVFSIFVLSGLTQVFAQTDQVQKTDYKVVLYTAETGLLLSSPTRSSGKKLRNATFIELYTAVLTLDLRQNVLSVEVNLLVLGRFTGLYYQGERNNFDLRSMTKLDIGLDSWQTILIEETLPSGEKWKTW